jgi:large subunit ribosomal protein L10
MAISRERKEVLVEKYTNLLQRTDGMIITEYRGMKMTQLNDIRNVLRGVNASYVVTKNRLFKIALNNMGYPVPDKLMTGPVAVSFAHGDLAAMVKALLDKEKDNELLTLKGGLIGNQVIGADQIKAISELPSLDVLRSQLAGLLVQPAQSLVNVLNAPPQNLVNVLQAGSESLANVLAAFAAKESAA